jgi:hypothetical protein
MRTSWRSSGAHQVLEGGRSYDRGLKPRIRPTASPDSTCHGPPVDPSGFLKTWPPRLRAGSQVGLRVVGLTGLIGPMKHAPSTSISKRALRCSAAPCQTFVIVMTCGPIGQPFQHVPLSCAKLSSRLGAALLERRLPRAGLLDDSIGVEKQRIRIV